MPKLSNDSIKKTFIVAGGLCLICSVLVSTVAVELRPTQDANKLQDKQKNILITAGIYDPAQDIAKQFEAVQTKVVDVESWEYVQLDNPASYDQKEAARDPERNFEVPTSEDIASIRTRAKRAVIYMIRDENNNLEKLILPIHGMGLWSTLYGFISLGPDLKTIKGLSFYEHGETPGLGGEVDNPNWKKQWNGKVAYGENGNVKIHVIKGQVNDSSPDAQYEVDGLSGATITSRGVSNLLQYWLGEKGFGPFLAKLRKGATNEPG